MKNPSSPRLPFRQPAPRFLLENHAVEDLLNNLLGLRIEARNGLELEFEGVVRAALVLIEKQLIRSYSEDYGHVADDIEGGLRDAPFVAF